MRILVADADPLVARSLALQLAKRSWATDLAHTGADALDLARHYEFDAAVVDLGLPDTSGLDVVRGLRIAGNTTPVIVTSAPSRRGQGSATSALAGGADDFLIKPFDKDELFARLQAIIRRSRGFSRAILSVGPMTIDLSSHEVTVGGRHVHLTRKEYALLELLVLRRGAALSKDAILNHLYSGLEEPEPKIIDVFVCKLRKRLAQAGADGLITTVWGRGYMIRTSQNGQAPDVGVSDVRELLSVA